MLRRSAIAWLALVVVAGSLWWGVHPPRSPEAYRQRTAMTVQMLHSQVASTRLWLQSVADDEVLRTTAAVAVDEAETGASGQSATFASWQPPDQASLRLRLRVSAVAERVVSALGDVRIAVREGRWPEAVDMDRSLARLQKRLERLQSAAERGVPG